MIVAERPILFSAPMIRAILAGQKTQTRRVVKWRNVDAGLNLQFSGLRAVRDHAGMWALESDTRTSRETRCDVTPCPYGVPGDRLWVRETFIAFGRWETRFDSKKGRDAWHFVDLTPNSGREYGFPADGDWPWPFKNKRALAGASPAWWTRPAIFMPRGATRIELEISGVRVERLQAISEDDARAEGVERVDTAFGMRLRTPHWRAYGNEDTQACMTAAASFQSLWEQIRGEDSWGANPWVWVVEFKRLEA